MDGRRSVSLPVLPERRHARLRGIAKWRAAVLGLVYVAIAAHVVHWLWSGVTVGRCVLSDSMRTLELGEINPGFMLFGLLLLVTAVVGRFFCGWLCHMGALQDLCAWLLSRAGIRPRLFRSRLLGYGPLVVASYMFLWPTAHRVIIAPLTAMWWPGSVPGLREFAGFSMDLSTRDLWEGLPGLWVAVVFLLLCGCVTVYFFGARGLCRYGCPYGGLLLPASQLAPVRVQVDPVRCDQCGLCTKACTGGVRVHDEVRMYGAVLDENCIRSLDCISSCPSNALTLGVGRPAVATRRLPARFDLSWPEELACALTAIVVFLVSRGIYDAVPMLMAFSLAALAGYCAWKTIRLVREPNVRIGGVVLRIGGRRTRWGHLFLVLVLMLGCLVAQSASVRIALLAAEYHDGRVTVGLEDALAGRASHEQRLIAGKALRWFGLTAPMGEGGLGLAPSPGVDGRVAWLHIVLGDASSAEATLLETFQRRPSDDLLTSLATVQQATGRAGEALRLLERHAWDRVAWTSSRQILTTLLLERNRGEDARRLHERALVVHPDDVVARCALGRVLIAQGRTDEGLVMLRMAVKTDPRGLGPSTDLALGLFHVGRLEEALNVLASLVERRPAMRPDVTITGTAMLNAAGRGREVEAWQQRLRK